MAMSAGSGGGGLTNEPNVTPMIDVLLVLLIIFMLVVPMARKAIDVQLPDPTPAPTAVQNSDQIVMEVCKNATYAINKQPVPKDQLPAKLKEIYDPRPDKIIFVKGCPEAKYQEVITAMDAARGAGVKVIGVPPKDTK
ncbi:MAG TPA: biopolymer transporter ExbD [Gemmatimonadaceae bacterium]|jgi:biopolymer transport protein TolR|nr:biopolymer transporter ExbD [Gemmatimonadaceae bacterium]